MAYGKVDLILGGQDKANDKNPEEDYLVND